MPRAGIPRHFAVGAEGPTITPRDAAAALIVLPRDRYLMQLRDDRPDIIYPGHWACFGGAVRAGEHPVEALRRELAEELELEMGAAHEFAAFEFDLRPAGRGRFVRRYFEVAIAESELGRLVLHEGAAMRTFGGRELLVGERVTPHDAFAVWLHASRGRVGVA